MMTIHNLILVAGLGFLFSALMCAVEMERTKGKMKGFGPWLISLLLWCWVYGAWLNHFGMA